MTSLRTTAGRLERCVIDRQIGARLAARTRRSVRIALFETVYDVRFENVDAAERFGRRYVDFISPLPSTRVLTVARDDWATYWICDERAYRWPESLEESGEIGFLTDTLVRHEFFSYGGSHVAFHAAALRIGRAAIAISGVSGSGKTTTTIACARRGIEPYSDEHCVLAGNRVVPFPRAIDIRRAAVATLAAEPAFEDRGIRERLIARGNARWSSARFADVFGTSSRPRAEPLAAIYFIVARGSNVAIEPLGLDAALTLYFGAFPLGHRTGILRVADAIAVLKLAPVFALTLGTPDVTARALLAVHER